MTNSQKKGTNTVEGETLFRSTVDVVNAFLISEFGATLSASFVIKCPKIQNSVLVFMPCIHWGHLHKPEEGVYICILKLRVGK